MPVTYQKLYVNSANRARPPSMTKLLCMTLFVLITTSACAEPELVANSKAGEKKSAICAQCHGQNGISFIPIYPNLAGQKKGYMILQLEAFRSGERINAAMSSHAKRLSDQDIADLSAYYANMEPCESNIKSANP